jgi:hypothetical protein
VHVFRWEVWKVYEYNIKLALLSKGWQVLLHWT